jgi:hypothetical protein
MRSIAGIEFGQNVAHVTIDRVLGDRQALGNELIGVAGGDQPRPPTVIPSPR